MFNWNLSTASSATSTTAKPAPAGAGGIAAGALFQTTAATTTTTAPTTNVSNPEYSTQYENLNQQWKGELHKILEYIESEKSKSTEISERSTELISKVKSETSVHGEKLNTLANCLERDRQTIARLRANVSRELQYAELAARTIERMANSGGLRLQQQFALPSKYFVEVSASFDERMKQYFLAINEIEQYLSASSSRRPYSPQTIGEIMRNQHELFMAIASQAAAIHDMVQQLKEKFVAYRNDILGTSDSIDDVFKTEKPKKSNNQQLRYVPPPEKAAAAPGTPAATTATPSLFGTPAPAATTPAGATGFNLFGAPAAATTPTASTAAPSLFGGGSLFGGPTTPSTAGLGMSTAGANLTFGATAPAAGGLFGGGGAAPAGRPATGKAARKGK